MTRLRIRPGVERDLTAIQDIERAAGGGFRELGMGAVADDPSPACGGETPSWPAATLRGYLRTGGLWVVADAGEDRPVAYLLLRPLDGCTHIEQISVHPDSARQRLGQALIEHAAAQAAAGGVPALTLSTFAEVPWNAPYYERCGFRRLAPGELTPGLRSIRAEEARAGLDRWPRVCMRRDLRTD